MLFPVFLYSSSDKERPHGDISKLPKGCGSCHVGHGKFNTAMLPERKEVFCFRCHGHPEDVDNTRRKGDLARSSKSADIQREFEKPYHHPIEKINIHRYGEILPEVDPSMPRHAECGDCHHHHLVSNENKMTGIRGTDRQRAKVSITSEYELCFNCHSYSANLPPDQTNKAELFSISNASFHPVLAAGRNHEVPSLMPPLTPSSQIKCTDCHNNDDPVGPKGPHGSTYKHLLSKNFSESDGSENPFQYELCYSCHKRNSILMNESFPYHDLHITIVGTSCKTCHNPHGSTHNQHLIDFDYSSVRPSKDGKLSYISLGPKAGQCYLNCHDRDHNPEMYPKGVQKPADQSVTTKKKK